MVLLHQRCHRIRQFLRERTARRGVREAHFDLERHRRQHLLRRGRARAQRRQIRDRLAGDGDLVGRRETILHVLRPTAERAQRRDRDRVARARSPVDTFGHAAALLLPFDLDEPVALQLVQVVVQSLPRLCELPRQGRRGRRRRQLLESKK